MHGVFPSRALLLMVGNLNTGLLEYLGQGLPDWPDEGVDPLGTHAICVANGLEVGLTASRAN
jgi:hypothetical protein